MRLSQQMKLAPHMIQSMEILQLPAMALIERIEQELASNPTLELRESRDDADQIKAERSQERRDDREGERELVIKDESKTNDHADDFERLSNFSDELGEAWEGDAFGRGESFRPVRQDGDRDVKLDAMANTPARPLSLTDQLLEQWLLVEAEPAIRKAGEFLIGHIDDDGYIRTDRQILFDKEKPHDLEVSELDEALELLKSTLEPVGLAASDVRECLLLQIDARSRANDASDLHFERMLVSEYLKDIESNRLPRIARATGVEIERIKEAICNLRQFYIHPGRMLVSENLRAIRPDAIIDFNDEHDCYQAQLTNGRLPAVQINPRYLKMVKDKRLSKQDREFIGNNMRSARWLLDAIEQRNNTLLRVIAVVVDAQRDFFEQGRQALRPLPMTVVADQLGIHVATVSRAVSEKYLQTPRGIYPLRMFFSGGTETESGDAMSWSAVQAKLQQIIQSEDKTHPLSDDQLVVELKKHGIDIARRTVAKYRKQLKILPARQRKEY